MATEKANPAPDDTGTPGRLSIMDVPDKEMEAAFPPEDAEPAPEAEPETGDAPEKEPDEKVEPETDTPPEPEPEPEPEAEPEAETGDAPETPAEEAFDPEAWAEAQNISPELVKACKTPLEAATAVARRLRHRERLDGRKDAEIAELRAKAQPVTPLEEPPPEASADTAPTVPAGPEKTEAEVKAEWTQEERDRFREWQEQAPEQAGRWMVQQQIAPLITALREENRRDMEAIRGEMKAVQQAPRNAELEQEYAAFAAAHPEDHDTFTAEEMPILAEALGLPPTAGDGRPTDVGRITGTKLEDLYALNQLRTKAPKMYGQIVRDMRQGLGFERARHIAEIELKPKPQDAAEREKERVRKARGASGASAGSGAAPMPETKVRNLGELPDEYFEQPPD